MRKRGAIVSIFILVCFLVLGVGLSLAEEGFHHVDPASELRHAKQDWQDDEVSVALAEFVSAYQMAVECGARWSVAGIYISNMRSLTEAERLREALNECMTAVHVLGKYDDEGVIGYDCDVIEAQIQRESP